MERFRFGLIGCGKWGRNFVKTMDNSSELELSIVCDPDIDGLEFVHHRSTANINDLLNCALDAVIIATPPQSHFEIAEKFLKARIPVFLEKPISININESRRLIELSSKLMVPLFVDYIHIYTPAFIELKNIVKTFNNDPLGIYSVGSNNGPFRDYDPLYDYGPHDISMVISLFNKKPDEIILNQRIDEGKRGKIYSLFMRFGKSWSRSYFGNGSLSKARKFHVVSGNSRNMVSIDDQNIVKLKFNDKPVIISSITPLESVLNEFVYSINDGSWVDNLNISSIVSDVLETKVIETDC